MTRLTRPQAGLDSWLRRRDEAQEPDYAHDTDATFGAVLALAAAATIGAPPSIADDYPRARSKIIVPFGAGGPTDVYTRAVAEELRKSLHQTFIMENRPGAGTTIGTDLVAKAAPDGYTLLMVSGTQTVNETLYTKKPYRLMRDWFRSRR